MARRPTYGIHRVEEASRFQVTIQRRGTIYRGSFSDRVLGGKQKAFNAAKKFRDKLIARYDPLPLREFCEIHKRNNKSKVVGVWCYCSNKTRDLPPKQQYWYWVASCPQSDGQHKRVIFPVNVHGAKMAKHLAIQARQEAIQALEGTFDPGRVRPGYPKEQRALRETPAKNALPTKSRLVVFQKPTPKKGGTSRPKDKTPKRLSV